MKIQELEIKYSPIKTNILIHSSQDAYEFLISNWDSNTIHIQEEFKIILMDRSNTIIGLRTVSKGGMTSTVVDSKIVFSVALKCLSSSIILAHNHPSGQIKPSEQDKLLTQKLREGAKLLDISILDHIIIGSGRYYSFADDGWI